MKQATKLIVAGLTLRLALAPFFMHLWDVTTVLTAADQFLKGLNPYRYVLQQTMDLQETTGLRLQYHGFAYLPSTLLLYAPFYSLYRWLMVSREPIVGGHGDIYTGLRLVYPDIYVALLLMKLPMIIADGLAIYLLARRSLRAAKAYAISPYVIIVTSLWGNFDPFIGLVLLASYLTFEKSKFLSGIMYGLSLMKLYTAVCIGAFLSHLYRQPKQLAAFLLGAALPQAPILYYLLTDPQSFLHVFLFQASRPINGVNIYYSIVEVRGLDSVTLLTRMIATVFAASILMVTIKLARRGTSLNEFIIALMLTYMVFAPVTNEQLLVALIPLGLLSRNFSHKLAVFSLLYIAFNSTYHYFAIPIFYSSGDLRAVWDAVNIAWGAMVKDYQLQIRYLLGVGMGLSAFWLLRNGTPPQPVNVRLRISPPIQTLLRIPLLSDKLRQDVSTS